MLTSLRWIPAFALAALLASPSPSPAATPPPGFLDEAFAAPGEEGVSAPTSVAFHPVTGDAWITEKGDGSAAGTARIRIRSSQGLVINAVSLPCIDSRGERGLLDLVFDPDFASNRFVYVFSTRRRDDALGCPPQGGAPFSLNVVSRFEQNGSTLENEVVLLEGPALLETSELHNGGTIRFLPDGTLLVSMGDNAVNSQFELVSQDLADLRGKMLRIARDGGIPADNPFVGVPGAHPAVWARGFRNPFRFSVDPVTGTVMLTDVGESSWEEIGLGVPGANYGWPCYEGPAVWLPCPPAPVSSYTFPILSYHHQNLTPPISGGAVVGGPFYHAQAFPEVFRGGYFFADYARRWIRSARLGPSGSLEQIEMFATNVPGPVDLEVGPDGCLYYAAILSSEVRRICAVGGDNGQPSARGGLSPRSGMPPLEVFADASASTDPDGDGLAYTWRFGDGGFSPQAITSHVYTAPGLYEATVSVNDRRQAPNSLDVSAPMTIVVGNSAPSAFINAPPEGGSYAAGQTILFGGEGVDPEDGTMAASSLSWRVIFHHGDHIHPFLGPMSGLASGSFTIPAGGEGDPNQAYEVILEAADSGAPLGPQARLKGTASVWLRPRVSVMTLEADPPLPGLALLLDGIPRDLPHKQESIAGWQRTLGAPLTQAAQGRTLSFESWSDGGAATHAVATPESGGVWTARYTCATLTVPANLALSPVSGGEVTLTWDPSSDPCLEDRPGRPRYAVYRSFTHHPAQLPGSFPDDPPFALIGTSEIPSFTLAPGPGAEFYLVVEIGRDGMPGPAGHYP
ncbi:MAG TPA: PQQ-dependent sugar dehydrogenase [Candidatus Polarisedimenticolia bacterium]|nr:PQQ-dependent sugar dehydrogenase [Candidatus Polarisedimenticolia bacterium]